MYKSHSPDETINIGYKTGQNAKEGEIYCLTGNLGTGKTVFAKGFAEGLGIKNDIVSPTFTIINEYEGRLPLFHLDVYRCEVNDMDDLGLDEYLFGNGVTLIEWADRIKELLPEYCIWIKIYNDMEHENIRSIFIDTSFY